MYEVWVVSDLSKAWERYTLVPFTTQAKAMAWAKRYIPKATYEIRSALQGGQDG